MATKGIRNGLYEYIHDNGQIMKRSNYKDGKRIENLPITEDKGAPAPRWEDENERIKEDRSVKNIKYHFGKKNKLKINKKDENKIGVALYVVNKEAKRCRDLSRWMYEDREPYPGAIKILQQLGDIGEEIEIDEYGQPFLEDEYSERFYSEEGLRETIMELQNEIDEAETKLEEEEDLSDIEKEELQETIDFNQDYIDTYSKYEDDLGSVSNVFYLIKKMKIRKIDLYNLKEQIIENLDDSYIIGRHKFPNGDVRDLYKIGDFTFHGEDIQDELSDEYDKIEEIDEISAENKLEDDKNISIGEAEKILCELLRSVLFLLN